MCIPDNSAVISTSGAVNERCSSRRKTSGELLREQEQILMSKLSNDDTGLFLAVEQFPVKGRGIIVSFFFSSKCKSNFKTTSGLD